MNDVRYQFQRGPVRPRGRALAAFVLLLVGLMFTAHSHASSRAEISVDGRRVIVEGGSNQAISSVDGGQKISVDGMTIVIRPGEITVDGETRALPDYNVMKIEVEGGKAKVSVDGKPL